MGGEEETIYAVGIHDAAPFYLKNGYLPINICKDSVDDDEDADDDDNDEAEFGDMSFLYANSLKNETMKEPAWLDINSVSSTISHMGQRPINSA
jgi:hypothetical protein